jgi:type II secretory pathway pseudopilin PulG
MKKNGFTLFKHNSLLSKKEMPRGFARTVTRRGGFTIVELMVSVGIFIFVLSAAMGALLSIVNVYRKTQTLHVVSDNVNLALEDISKNIIQGTNFHCDAMVAPITDARSCNVSGTSSIVFVSNDNNKKITYWLDTVSHEIMKDVDTVAGKLTTGSVVTIEELRFRVFAGEGVGSKDQPRVIVNIRGTAIGAGDTSSSFDVQTTAVQRTPKY